MTDSLASFKPTHWAGAGVVGEFVRDEKDQVIGSRVLSARVHPTVAEQADAPLSNSGEETREGSTPSRGTHVHLPELGEAFYDRGQRMRRSRCRVCGEELEARRG